LALTFNEMLSRLESERRESTRRVLGAQESERLRIAQELHDQVGQELTAVLLGLSRISSQVPPLVKAEVTEAADAVRNALEDVRRIAVELRPEALDELGLDGALAVLAERFSRQLGLDVSERIPFELPSIPAEHELVIYRVAQEALTNVVRHGAAGRAELRLERAGGRVVLTVADDGLGLPPYPVEGTGIRGMRERAALIGATLEIRNRDSGSGAEVRLEVPLGEASQ
jgi:two-component system sensor histidine kinase UhpB